MRSRLLPLTFALLAVAAVSNAAVAQSYTGTYTISGGTVPITLTLRQAGNRITGTMRGQGPVLQIEAQVEDDGFEGRLSNANGRGYIVGEWDGSGNLRLLLADLGADGEPVMSTARLVTAVRGGGGEAGRASTGAVPGGGKPSGAAAAPSGGAGASGASGGAGRAATGAGTPQDRQLAQLLMRSAWCSFRYVSAGGSSGSGRSSTERVVFRADGTGSRATGSESSYSGSGGSVYGSSSGGEAFRWRVQSGALVLTDQNGASETIQLQVTTNSNGYPIITASGTEYSMCN